MSQFQSKLTAKIREYERRDAEFERQIRDLEARKEINLAHLGEAKENLAEFLSEHGEGSDPELEAEVASASLPPRNERVQAYISVMCRTPFMEMRAGTIREEAAKLLGATPPGDMFSRDMETARDSGLVSMPRKGIYRLTSRAIQSAGPFANPPPQTPDDDVPF